MSEVSSKKLEVRSKKSEVRSRKLEVKKFDKVSNFKVGVHEFIYCAMIAN